MRVPELIAILLVVYQRLGRFPGLGLLSEQAEAVILSAFWLGEADQRGDSVGCILGQTGRVVMPLQVVAL